MIITGVTIYPFRSINQQQKVELEKDVTVLVGMNEAGKTVFLQALQKTNDALQLAKFDTIVDYPRKDYTQYARVHKSDPATVVEITYQLTAEEINHINSNCGVNITEPFDFTIIYKYDNSRSIRIKIDETPAIRAFAKKNGFSTDSKKTINTVQQLRDIPDVLNDVELTDPESAGLEQLKARIAAAGTWESICQFEVWQLLSRRLPKFLYFSDYDILPSKMNLTDLSRRVKTADPKKLEPQHRAVLALLRMANIPLEEFVEASGYEELKTKIEAVSISLTDSITSFWKQNEDLEVEIDIKEDSADLEPYNDGPNIYLRIKNRKHRGVSTPFQQRSRGFIWFFSFLVWFDSIQFQLDDPEYGSQLDLVLLLDEPGLALHAMAQADFLKYIEGLSDKHQVVYTTHSPFMISADKLHQVRVVEDRLDKGTIISSNVSEGERRTLFPLQAALGWNVAQNLFISKRNLLVEGPSDMIYLTKMSGVLETLGKTGLRNDVTIVPVGGLDNIVTFISLLGANGLELAVLYDESGKPEQKLIAATQNKLIHPKNLISVAQFREIDSGARKSVPSDTEDLFDKVEYLALLNATFKDDLHNKIKLKDLPNNTRIIRQIEIVLENKEIELRPSGGFNHYRVAAYFVANAQQLTEETINRFERLFLKINEIFK